MTLAELIPSLRGSLPRPVEPGLWPPTVRTVARGDLTLGGVSLVGCAEAVGTPTVLVDVADLRARLAAVAAAFRGLCVACPGSALMSGDALAVVEATGMALAVWCEAQLAVATAAGFPVERMVVHGDGARPCLLRRAIGLGAGRIVVGSAADVDLLARCAPERGEQAVLLAVRVGGVDGVSRLAAGTGAARGLRPGSDEAYDVAARIVRTRGLRLAGLSCTTGSPEPPEIRYAAACRDGLTYADSLRRALVEVGPDLLLGDSAPSPNAHGPLTVPQQMVAASVRRTLAATCADPGRPEPIVLVEPGWAVAGPSSVTLCRVTGVATITDGRTVVRVDAPLDVNPAVNHQAMRSAHLLGRLSPAADVRVEIASVDAVGGSSTIHDAFVPGDVRVGDLLAIPSSGNPRHSEPVHHRPHPALVAAADGISRLIAGRSSGRTDILRRRTG